MLTAALVLSATKSRPVDWSTNNMSTAPTPPGTAIAAIALTGPPNCIAFRSGTALMRAKESERPNHTQRINLDFIKLSPLVRNRKFRHLLFYEFLLLGVTMEPRGTKGPSYTSLWVGVQINLQINRI